MVTRTLFFFYSAVPGLPISSGFLSWASLYDGEVLDYLVCEIGSGIYFRCTLVFLLLNDTCHAFHLNRPCLHPHKKQMVAFIVYMYIYKHDHTHMHIVNNTHTIKHMFMESLLALKIYLCKYSIKFVACRTYVLRIYICMYM